MNYRHQVILPVQMLRLIFSLYDGQSHILFFCNPAVNNFEIVFHKIQHAIPLPSPLEGVHPFSIAFYVVKKQKSTRRQSAMECLCGFERTIQVLEDGDAKDGIYLSFEPDLEIIFRGQ